MSACCFLCNFLTFCVAVPFLIIYGINYGNHLKYDEYQCHISNVIYPTSLPHNTSHTTGFVDCDCGRRCISDLGTCISIYGKVVGTNDTKMFNENIIHEHIDNECTFRESLCPDGERAEDRLIAINQAIEQAQNYLNIMDSNETINCYQDGNNLYFDNRFDMAALVLLSIIVFFVLIIFFVLYQKHRNKMDNSSKQNMTYNDTFNA